MTQNLRCNEQIRISPVRLIGENNEQIGIVPTHEALRMAQEAGLDLVEVAPNVRPPVCRIMDYGKWKYYQKKNVKKHHEQQLKEVRLRPKTDEHDRSIKIRNALEFLRRGDKVQFTMVFRGRERSHREIGLGIFQSIIAELGERVKVERAPAMDGRHMVMIVVPNKAAFEKGDAAGAAQAPGAAATAGAAPASAAGSTGASSGAAAGTRNPPVAPGGGAAPPPLAAASPGGPPRPQTT